MDSYCLLDSSFTFFWGRYSTIGHDDSQIFRAEWSQEGHGSNDAAHPHWHVDLFPLVREISSIHLGMAGWDCREAAEGSMCWQRFVGDDLGQLELWCERTLDYSIDQMINYL